MTDLILFNLGETQEAISNFTFISKLRKYTIGLFFSKTIELRMINEGNMQYSKLRIILTNVIS